MAHKTKADFHTMYAPAEKCPATDDPVRSFPTEYSTATEVSTSHLSVSNTSRFLGSPDSVPTEFNMISQMLTADIQMT